MPIRAQQSLSNALAFTTCSSLRLKQPKLLSIWALGSLSFDTWALCEPGMIASNSNSSCLLIRHKTELFSLFLCCKNRKSAFNVSYPLTQQMLIFCVNNEYRSGRSIFEGLASFLFLGKNVLNYIQYITQNKESTKV